ncbi:protein FAR-RED IMPAIRED RESPONSE 1-like [Camellia sinensis]|uniref:protein FAR-RED IMPAIRED RESPONSE 1-like n=1 Tax=Camellia sinensis TaxID=4442 RepID=UPI001035A1E2|nr:protein FAR-RED IMPAIRED RESPONSE 1-like [Camellia sinensis]
MNKRILTPVKRRLEVNDAAGIRVARNFHSIVVEAEGYEALTFDEQDARNYIQNARRLRLGVGDAKSVTFYFHKMQQQNSNFFSAIDLDEDGRMRNLFWADIRSRAAYKAFGDVCRAMQNAIEIVFPQDRHRWCLWHIMKKIPEKLRGYSQYESIKVALSNAVYDSFTKDEFEEYWEAMIENFNLNDNEWLGVLYNDRHRWIPAYVKDIFWARMSTTQRSESMNAFFDGYVNSKTTLKQFVEQYDNALRSKIEKETKADFKSCNKLYDCLMVYRLEKQFRAAYTNSKFKEVQLEMKCLVYCRANLIKEECAICTYHVREAVVVGEGMKKAHIEGFTSFARFHGYRTAAAHKHSSKSVVFSPAVSGFAQSDLSEGSSSSNNELFEEAKATIHLGKCLGINYNGKEDTVLSKIIDLELKDKDKISDKGQDQK